MEHGTRYSGNRADLGSVSKSEFLKAKEIEN